MFGIGMQELLVILVLVLVIFGAKRLPEIGSGLGRAIRNFRQASSEPDEIDITPKDKSKTDEEIFYQDFKRFTAGRVSFGVGQISSLNQQELEQLKTRMLPYLQKARQAHGVSMIFFMLTNILTESTVLLCEGAGAGQMILEAFHMENDEAAEKQAKDGVVYLQGVVSRKKQLVPAIAMALQE